jgi:hypothetical protein
MNKNSMFIPIMAIFLLTGVLSGTWPLAGPVHAQNNNQTTAATVDQWASNSELPIKQQLKAEIPVPIYYTNTLK